MDSLKMFATNNGDNASPQRTEKIPESSAPATIAHFAALSGASMNAFARQGMMPSTFPTPPQSSVLGGGGNDEQHVTPLRKAGDALSGADPVTVTVELQKNFFIDEMINCFNIETRGMLDEMLRQQHATMELLAAAREEEKVKEAKEELEQAKARQAELEREWKDLPSKEYALGAKYLRLQQENEALNIALREAYARQRLEDGNVEPEEEHADDVQNENSEMAARTMRACRVCRLRMAAMELWPCCHLSLCKTCDEMTNTCPVCHAVYRSSHEVGFNVFIQ